jgi:predicted permease
MSCYIPFSPSGYGKTVVPEGYQFPKGRESASTGAAVVDEHYFATMKTAIVRGRGFTVDDKSGTRRVAVVNEEFAKAYWPKQDPIGKRFRLNDTKGPWVEVVGLTKTNKYYFVGELPNQFLYLPFAQEQNPRMSLIVETEGDPAAIATPLREAVRTLDPNQPIYNVRTFSSFYEQRATFVAVFLTQLVATMGLLGLALALVGLYGLIAYSVSRRTREIGIRMAIGASRAGVVKMVLRQGLLLVGGGLLVGSVLSYVVAVLLSAGLAGLGAPNPITYVVVPVALVLITMAACCIPARRASLINPTQALRCE